MANKKAVPPAHSQFKPGQSGHPGGKPKAARNRIQGDFLNALADDFEKHGCAAIQAAREKDPAAYLRVVASLLPKQVEQLNPLEDLSDAELQAAIDHLRGCLSKAHDGRH